MRTLIFTLLLLFGTSSLFGQTRYHINYDKPYKLRVNSETKIGKESFYDVDFLNSDNQVIKSIQKIAEENHNSKRGYDIQQSITYNFYSDTLKEYSISLDLIDKVFFKTVNNFQNGNNIGWVSYSLKPKISKDSFQTIIAKDLFLNHPDKFPGINLTVESKMVKRFENVNLVYKCYYERYGNLKNATAAREQFFKYNDKGLIIEHISNPKSDAGGTAFMRQTFEYNDKNQLIKREWYENGKHQCTDDFEYADKTIVERQKFYEIYGNGDPTKFTVMTTFYKLGNDGLYYSDNSFRTKFKICNDLD
jgi:hypothetical protein